MDNTWYEFIEWTGKMARRYGDTATDTDGRTWGWGQVICRVLYGPDWNDSPEFEQEYSVSPNLPAPEQVMKLIATWEDEWPECIERKAQ